MYIFLCKFIVINTIFLKIHLIISIEILGMSEHWKSLLRDEFSRDLLQLVVENGNFENFCWPNC